MALSVDAHDVPVATLDLEEISDALDALTTVEPALAEIVDLKYFCGFSFDEIAAMKGQSARTIHRQWTKARVYLHATIRAGRLPM